MKFNTAAILCTFALTSSAAALPSWGDWAEHEEQPIGPFAIQITGSPKYEGKYVILYVGTQHYL